jgi:hypothetical protein
VRRLVSLILPSLTRPGFIAGALSFLLPVAFLPYLEDSPDADVPRYALLALLACGALWLPVKLRAEHWLGMAFTAWAAVSLAWTADIYDGIGMLLKLAVLAGIFLIGAGLPTLKPIWIGLGSGFAVNSLFAIAQHYGYEPVLEGPGPAGLFINKNYLAEPAVLVLVALLAYRLRWLALPVLPCVVLPPSRGAWLALAMAGVGVVWTKSRIAAALLAFAGALVIAVLLYRMHDYPAQERLEIWYETIAGMTPFGNGFGSFYVDFPEHALLFNNLAERATHAHNDYLELTFELGPGALIYLAFLGMALQGPFCPEKLVLIAFMTEECFGFPLYFPIPAALAAIAAGRLARERVPLRIGAYLRGMRIQGRREAWRRTFASGCHAHAGARGISVRS